MNIYKRTYGRSRQVYNVNKTHIIIQHFLELCLHLKALEFYGNKIETLQFVNSLFETMKSILELLQSHIVLINPFHVQQT